MNSSNIEEIIRDAQDMSSETTFNLEGGFGKIINYERYANLLEGLLRKFLLKVDQND